MFAMKTVIASSAVSATAQVRFACLEGSHIQCLSMTVKHRYFAVVCYLYPT